MKIKQKSGRKDERSGYARIFGNGPLGLLFSQVHAAVISSGTELERILVAKSPYSLPYRDLNISTSIIEGTDQPVLLLHKLTSIEQIEERRGAKLEQDDTKTKKYKGDFLILYPRESKGTIIEVKDGDTFDTKKVAGEIASLRILADYYSQTLSMSISFAFSSFYAPTRSAITKGSKNVFNESQVLTGLELCQKIGIDYDAVVKERKADAEPNLNFFLDEMLKMDDIRKMIEEKLSKRRSN